jgi:hypothetical protein
MAITSKSKKKPANIELVDKALYAFNTDLQRMVYDLNYRWLEMVQYNPRVELKNTFPSANVTPTKKHGEIADIRGNLELELELEDSGDETDPETEEELEGGGKKKRKHTTKKLHRTTKKRKHKKSKHLKRRRQQSRVRRS